MVKTQAILQREHTPHSGGLCVSLELGAEQCKLSCGDGRHNASRYMVKAGDTEALMGAVRQAKKRFGLPQDAPVHSCYEAGRDGWWLHRWLVEHGVHNIVVESSSIEVNRRSRRAKNDRLDADKLLTMLLRYVGGERGLWTVLKVPNAQQEDQRRLDREIDQLTHERTRHVNRIGSLLVLHNLKAGNVAAKAWTRWWTQHGEQVPAMLRAEIERQLQRLALVQCQLKELLRQRHEQVQSQASTAAQLLRLRAIGETSALKLDKELFGWRQFDNRRQVASSIGLTPTPYDSGGSQVEQGISKAGNKRVRALLIELAWGWLRLQPQSELSGWYQRRFANAGKRMRRVGIVAVARKLAIALWRYLKFGEIPAGAQLKPIE